MKVYSKIGMAVVVCAFAFGLLIPMAQAADREVYVSTTCPHCTTVKEFLEESGGADEFEIEVLDVYVDDAASDQFTARLEEAGQDPMASGVPTMFYEGEMVVGSTPIIDFIKEKHGITEIAAVESPTSESSSNDNIVAATDEEGAGFGMWFIIVIIAAGVLGVSSYVYKNSKNSNTSK